MHAQVTWLVVTEVWSESFGLVTQSTVTTSACYVPSVIFCLLDGVLCAVTHTFLYWTSFTVMHVIFSSSSVVSRALSVLCVYSTFGHHSHPWATFVPNFVCVAGPVAELAHGEKSHTQSCHSVIHLAYLMTGNRSFRCGKALQSVTF